MKRSHNERAVVRCGEGGTYRTSEFVIPVAGMPHYVAGVNVLTLGGEIDVSCIRATRTENGTSVRFPDFHGPLLAGMK